MRLEADKYLTHIEGWDYHRDEGVLLERIINRPIAQDGQWAI